MTRIATSTTRAVERCEQLAKLGAPPPWWRVFAVRRWLRAYRAIAALDIGVHAELLRSIYTTDSIKAMAEAKSGIVRKDGIGGPRKWVEPVEYEP